MKKTKRLIGTLFALLLVLPFAIGMVGCGGSDDTQNQTPKPIEYIDITTSEQFIQAMSNGENKAYKLVNDIIITDKTLDETSSFQSQEYCFDIDFCGILDGNYNIVFFNLENRSLQKSFDGVFKSISGTIKRTNFAIYVQSHYVAGDEKGIVTPLLTGKIDQCIVTYDVYGSSCYNVCTPILRMGGNAEISKTIIRRECRTSDYNNYRLCEYQLVKYAEPTSKLTKVALLGNCWGWTGKSASTSQVMQALPQTKCDVNGFWLFEPGDREQPLVLYIKLGYFTYGLNNDKYTNPNSPANVLKTERDISTKEIEVLFDANNPRASTFPAVSMGDFGYDVALELLDLKVATHDLDNDIVEITEYKDHLILDFFI